MKVRSPTLFTFFFTYFNKIHFDKKLGLKCVKKRTPFVITNLYHSNIHFGLERHILSENLNLLNS